MTLGYPFRVAPHPVGEEVGAHIEHRLPWFHLGKQLPTTEFRDHIRVYKYFTRPEAIVFWMSDYALLEAQPGGRFDLAGCGVRR